MHADKNHVTIEQLRFGDFLAVHKGAVQAAQILQHELVTFHLDGGVVPGHRLIVDDDVVVRLAADRRLFLVQRNFLDGGLLIFQ